MKRIAIGLSVVFIAAGGLVVNELIAAPPESEELTIPLMSPEVITPDVPTFVTFTVDFSQDPNLKSPKLQIFDSTRGRWKTVVKLRDDGRFEDTVKKDGVYNVSPRLLDSGGATKIQVFRSSSLKLLWEGVTPLELRLVATKKGQRGILTSARFSLPSALPVQVSVGGSGGNPPADVDVPQTFDLVDSSDPARVRLQKFGPSGYGMVIFVEQNPADLSLEHWVISCFLNQRDPCNGLQPGDPQNLGDVPFGPGQAVLIEPITVGALAGIKLRISDPEDFSYEVFLDDPAHQRVFNFHIYVSDRLTQEFFFTENLEEALSVVQSLQQ
jgi:hypothetical protein